MNSATLAFTRRCLPRGPSLALDRGREHAISQISETAIDLCGPNISLRRALEAFAFERGFTSEENFFPTIPYTNRTFWDFRIEVAFIMCFFGASGVSTLDFSHSHCLQRSL
jgi:hypothetical protein